MAPADRPALQRNLGLLAALAEHRRRLRLEVGGPLGGGCMPEGTGGVAMHLGACTLALAAS